MADRWDTHELLEKERGKNPAIRRAVFASGCMCAMTCRTCGHVDTFEAFTETPIAGPTPRDVFQCPACREAVRRVQGLDKWGLPQCDLVPCQAAL